MTIENLEISDLLILGFSGSKNDRSPRIVFSTSIQSIVLEFIMNAYVVIIDLL